MRILTNVRSYIGIGPKLGLKVMKLSFGIKSSNSIRIIYINNTRALSY